ncbi:helix-turn-helix domain-containing protein [Halomontanus rarus]|uniref:helix-turn-helix domain-containing protein n=1 Tax=Halomontanus rarus TaxID=3034020 RepID=UPI00293BCD1C|nr:helix-turn-helix domain-containing protein [Halovivax sp. KZCA124]
MTIEATFTVPPNQFLLGNLFEHRPGVMVESERIIPSRDMTIYLWIRGITVGDIESTLTKHSAVENIQLVDDIEDEYLLRAELDIDSNGVLSTLTETNCSIINASGTNQQWTFEIRGDTRNEISDFQTRCLELGISITLTELHALTPVNSETQSAVTDAQQEALVLAYNHGYFESPHEVTMEELGDELGITQQAIASRLRRGIKQILGRTLSDIIPQQD